VKESETRAGTARRSIQNDTHEMATIMPGVRESNND
jgi:hypothetical protein